ncbi:hypothetical protein Pmani_004754 [Petrolisthes manimaculis]|uniref:Translation initiation factor 3 N-terminal domain-containing protein n=1 Tax=Petrolisthes manimaculis TaxID=1843537 RepID=A0AAE1QE23_9EUCA|nr:hypothetical protein Pmani_004754 [Petrolisthes manimaculis]
MSRLISTTTQTLLKKKGTGDNFEQRRTPKRIHTDDDSPVIILIDREEKLSTTTLMQAGKMAKRRDLKLVKIEDPTLNKTKDVYKLLTGKEYYEQEVKAKKNAKISQELKLVEKKIVFTSKIGPRDLTNKLQNIHKWLMKSYQIKVYLNSTGTKEDMDNTFSTIEKEVAQLQGHIQQVKESANSFKFYIVPTKVKEAKAGKPPENSISKD